MSQTIGIIASVEREIAILLSLLEGYREEVHAGCQIFIGKISGAEVVVIQTGHGKTAAAIGASVLIERYQVCLIISTGAAGGLQRGVQHGHLVIASELAYHDVNLPPFELENSVSALLPNIFLCDSDFIRVAQQTAKEFKNTIVHVGLMVCGDQFIQNSRNILKRFPEALAVDTQSAAIAQACFYQGVPYIVIRAISDSANSQAEEDYQASLDRVCVYSCEMTVSVIEHAQRLLDAK